MKFKKLFEGTIAEGKEPGKLVAKPKAGDYVIIHTSKAYDPMVTIVTKSELKEYFTEDMGWDPEQLNQVVALKTGASIGLTGGLGANEVLAVKV